MPSVTTADPEPSENRDNQEMMHFSFPRSLIPVSAILYHVWRHSYKGVKKTINNPRVKTWGM